MGRGVINFQNFHKISKFVYHESDIFFKVGFAEIPYINKGLLVYLVFSIFWNNMWVIIIHKLILKNYKYRYMLSWM